MTNFDLAENIFELLRQSSVETIVVCAGARNAPLVMALVKTNFRIIPFYEERSAAFFALGLIKNSGRPVAVLITSGTAVAEILPAAIEATYQGLPLIIVSADRPKAYRQSGAPQSIEQIGIFSKYCEVVYDLDVYSKNFDFEWSFRNPIHLNVCFDEPLLDQPSKGEPKQNVTIKKKNVNLNSAGKKFDIENPFIIVSEVPPSEHTRVKDFLMRWETPFYAEPLSHMNLEAELDPFLIQSEALLKKLFSEKKFNSLIRIGGVPTLRFWRDLESDFKNFPVFNFSDLSYTGLARPSEICSYKQLSEISIRCADGLVEDLKRRDEKFQKLKDQLLLKYPMSEPTCVLHLSLATKATPIYLGNSLPIRHWDAFAKNQSTQIFANRGANGIDGQISTYLGWSEKFDSSVCLIGDLTALYDLSSLGLSPQLRKSKRQIVVLNNFGGQIFQRIFKNDLFINSHKIEFQHWAKMWNWHYQIIQKPADFIKLHNADLSTIVEIQPDPQQTKQFWDEWDIACQKI